MRFVLQSTFEFEESSGLPANDKGPRPRLRATIRSRAQLGYMEADLKWVAFASPRFAGSVGLASLRVAMVRAVAREFNNELLPYPAICYHFRSVRSVSGLRLCPGLGLSNQKFFG